ncbi:MAG: Tn3 family transposase [Propionivibrio sp.]|uniref:Tn3 family transposase n=1 Tax=Candidatus Propionivibrio dominans TaxID=2954373 RepID=A0A9D7I6Z9_9RHOO|nr:Tn3 family transposase [Candidatus Propionivibrio dominans]
MAENWKQRNNFIFYGEKEIATNRIEDQELAMLSLHLLQACLVYVNTLFIPGGKPRPSVARAHDGR